MTTTTPAHNIADAVRRGAAANAAVQAETLRRAADRLSDMLVGETDVVAREVLQDQIRSMRRTAREVAA